MSQKSARIEAIVDRFRGREMDAHYLAYFECFNQQLFFEAHEVLEVIWLGQRHGPNGAFYKGLIQFAGAFVHVQKGRLGPAQALLKLALANLGTYPSLHEQLRLARVQRLAGDWLQRLAADGTRGELLARAEWPKLFLEGKGP